MKPYLLIIDSEASGLPKKWNLPYSASDNWPHLVQLSWLLYTREGELLEEHNYYINNPDFISTHSALKIHGITEEFRLAHGHDRKDVLALLAHDLIKYQPLIVGHFTELDLHFIGAEFYRAGMDNPARHLPVFCTMKGTTQFVRNPQVEHLRLNELYTTLFNTKMDNQHNSLFDARATAECFFELYRRGEIDDDKILSQQPVAIKEKNKSYSVSLLILFIITGLLVYFL